MANNVDFQIDHKGIAEMIRTSLELKAACRRVAERLAAEAKAVAPRRSGAFADSIHVEDGMSPKGDRVAAYVVADSNDAIPVEFGTRRQSGHHTLASVAR